ncbi:sigma-54-dependent Fis family transcriptional regulator [Desulfopila sp. IMCC35008]|uniref:sigma-54 interaction domain-containing protein n=1 Tax=Desulfopila sp. IMCC35008 TaxID=2653858 RepID=UPI0013D3C206|nr:sigma 54-interacting transcriptional regulator [Desulfopila sp. IMCC35008]
MYRLLDLHNCKSDIKISPKQPSAVLDTASFAISAITRDGNLIYCNRAFLHDNEFDPRCAFNTSIQESMPELWQKFQQPGSLHESSFKVINLRSSNYASPLGHLLVSIRDESFDEDERNIHSLVSIENHPAFIESYVGLYLASPQADTIKVNPSYEKIAFLPESDLVGRNLAELVDKGFFSKSVTLSILDALKCQGTSQQTLFQTLLCGKDVLVTGKPIFTDQNELAYILTYVQDLVVLDTIAQKCLEHEKRLSGSVTNIRASQKVGNKSKHTIVQEALPIFPELQVVAKDPQTISTLRKVIKASKYEAPVLLTGETGVGKDLLAKYIHLLQERNKPMPFVSVNCSAIPGDLLESELFGYEEGAFSGARKKGRAGLFPSADGGILFLNEISEIPLDLQAKLLTALDEGVIRPLGSSKTKKVKTRILCATNRNLRECVHDGTFRSDLYYRIKVLTIKMSPVRERPGDILPLVHHFMSRLASEHGLIRFLSPEVQEILLKYTWPGNVREIRNVVEQLVIYSSTSQVSLGDLPEDLLDSSAGKFQPPLPELEDGVSLRAAVQKYEKGLITKALTKYGSSGAAAKVLGIDPTTLARKLKKTS